MDDRAQPTNRKLEQGRATRERLLSTATRLFSEHSYEGTSIEMVLNEADVSRGSLYHHFANKEALFEAVLEQVETMIEGQVVAAAVPSSDPMQALRAGCRAFLQVAADPTIRRIAMIDAPAVVGWQKWREIDARHGFGLLRAALGGVAAMGRIPVDSVDLLSHMLLAALLEAALFSAHGGDATRDQQGAILDEFVTRLVG